MSESESNSQVDLSVIGRRGYKQTEARTADIERLGRILIRVVEDVAGVGLNPEVRSILFARKPPLFEYVELCGPCPGTGEHAP